MRPTEKNYAYKLTMGSDSEELAIMDRFDKGNEAAFEELVLKYQGRIYNLCKHTLGDADEAADAAQDAFIKAYGSLKNFRSESSFHTWLYRIAVNTCIDYKRKPFFESFFKNSDIGEEMVIKHPSDRPSPEKDYESKEIRLALQNALRKLSPKLRAVIVLKEIEGLSYERMAETLDVSIGTVKSRISRAREELKELLKVFTEQK